MQNRVKQRRSTDENQIAFELVNRSTQEHDVPATVSEYMAAIGRKGGQIGGKRRLKTMTAEERQRIARKAARAKWAKARKSK